MRYKLTIEYEGTRYSGWQIQPRIKTIQGVITDAISNSLNQKDVAIYGSGRTDSGVHALEQTAHFDSQTKLKPEIIRHKINDLLPHDINILNIEKVASNFHARHDAMQRSYVYLISKRRTAFGKTFVWWLKDKLDTELMIKSSQYFLGLHNFVSFADKNREDGSTSVKVEGIEFYETNSMIIIRIAASHFLWKMVRRMVGLIVEVGRKNLNPNIIENALNNYTDLPARYTAPPSGLYLEKVLYSANDTIKPLEEIYPRLPFQY